jgi:hypothetical protein
MRSAMLLKASAAMLLSLPTAACVSTEITNDVPHCEKLVPQMLLDPTPGADLPEPRKLADGHEDALPWEVGFTEQSGQLEKANEKPPAVDHIYRECLALHRDALARAKRGFFARLFG